MVTPFSERVEPQPELQARVPANARTRTIFEIFFFICSLLSVYLISEYNEVSAKTDKSPALLCLILFSSSIAR